MTQIANIVVKNGAATPADVTFVAYQPQSGSDPAVWYAKTGDTRNKWTSLTSTVRRTPNKASKLRFNITIPLFDVLGVQYGSIPTSVEMTIADVAPATNISDAQAYLANIMASAVIKDMILTASPAI